MFEDILEHSSTNKNKDGDDYDELCPICRSDEIGTDSSGNGLLLFCLSCGHTWSMD